MKLLRIRIIPALIVIGIFSVIGGLSLRSLGTESSTGSHGEGVTALLSEVMFTEFVAPFLLVGVLLVAALIAGVYLAKSETQRRQRLFRAVKKKPRFEAEKAMESMEEKPDDSD